MEKHRPFRQEHRGCIFGIISILLAVGVMVMSMNYKRPDDTLCRGPLGAGFPVPFICDASGESPLSSVGKIDWTDLDSVNPLGSFIDILFYTLALWVTWYIVRRIFL